MALKSFACAVAGALIAAGALVAPVQGKVSIKHNTCDCIPTVNKPLCTCVKKFTMRPWDIHDYYGQCSYFNDLEMNSYSGSKKYPDITSWTDGKYVYKQSMHIGERGKYTDCDSHPKTVKKRISQECTNWNTTRRDTIENTVTCWIDNPP